MHFKSQRREELNQIKDLIALFKRPKQFILETYSPYFYHYFRDYFAHPENLIRNLNEMNILLSRINSEQCTFLDLGCGFGLESTILSLITNSMKIIGIDHNQEKIRLARKLAEDCKVRDLDFIVHKGENLPEKLKVDVVFCRSVISHVNDIKDLFESIINILNNKGILYIIDDRNGLNPLKILKTRKLQHKAEKGLLKPEKLRELDSKRNFFEIRKEIISRNFEYMDDKKIHEYAQITAGLYGDGILSFVASAEKGGKIERPRFKYVNPITGESYERLYNPFYIKKLLKEKGMEVIIDKPFLGFSRRNGLKRILASLIENSHPLSLLISPRYYIKAIKLDG